jgi:hypothetical protein
VTPRDDLRDRIANVLRTHSGSVIEVADRIVALGLVDASNAREGWLHENERGWLVGPKHLFPGEMTRVLMIPAEDAS